MDLLENYLNAVRADLPKAQADDILAEIAEHLQSQMDERAARLGRPLTRDEVAATIVAYGHPRVVAARYSQHQYLIGPALLPVYWYCLRIAVTVVVAVELAAGLLGAIALGNHDIFARSLGAAWNSVFFVVGVVTVIFALIERFPQQPSPLDKIGITKWDPRTLKPTEARPVPYLTSIFDILANGTAALVLLDIGEVRQRLLETLAIPSNQMWQFQPTAAWQPLYVTMVIASIAIALAGVVTLARTQSSTLRSVVMVAANALVLGGAAFTLHAGPPYFVHGSTALNQLCIWGIDLFIVIAAITETVYAFALVRKTPTARTA